MKCSQARPRLVELLDRDPEANGALQEHLDGCLECSRRLEDLRQTFSALEPPSRWGASPQLKERIMNTVPERAPRHVRVTHFPWKVLTAAAAALVLVLTASLGLWYARTGGTQPLSAFAVLGQAAYAMANLQTVHIKAMMRTDPNDNFEQIRLNAEPVTVELWKEFGQPERWRAEKPGRVVVMDGQRAVLWVPSARLTAEGEPGCGMIEWLRPLLEPYTLLEREMKAAAEQGFSLSLAREAGPSGADELVVRIDAQAQGDFSRSSYGRDSSITSSDNLRVYRFDPETKRLTGLQVYVHQPQGDVLVFETEAVTYDEPLNDDLFALSIPADAVQVVQPEVAGAVPDAATPEGAARGFFAACAAEDWALASRYTPLTSLPQEYRDVLGKVQVNSIGTPFQSGRYGGWYVPYEVRLKSGETKKGNLAVRNDNPAKQYVFDGGI